VGGKGREKGRDGSGMGKDEYLSLHGEERHSEGVRICKRPNIRYRKECAREEKRGERKKKKREAEQRRIGTKTNKRNVPGKKQFLQG